MFSGSLPRWIRVFLILFPFTTVLYFGESITSLQTHTDTIRYLYFPGNEQESDWLPLWTHCSSLSFFLSKEKNEWATKDSISCFSAKSIMPSSSAIHFFRVLQVHVCSIKSPPFIAVPHPTPRTQIDTVDSSLLKVWGGHKTRESREPSWVE